MLTQQTLTYGVLPTQESFDEAFDRECPGGSYNIQLSRSDSRAVDGFLLGDGDWTAEQLWKAVTEIVTVSQLSQAEENHVEYYAKLDGAMDLVSSILGTLGFEWV